MTDILEVLQLQKNVQELQALQESFRSHTKIFPSLTDIWDLLQLNIGNYLGVSETPRIFYQSYKNIHIFERHFGPSTTSEKCLGTPGTPGDFQKSYKIFPSLTDILQLLQLLKNIQVLQELQESFRSHTKIFTSLTDILELLIIRKRLWTSRNSGSLVEVIQKYLQV